MSDFHEHIPLTHFQLFAIHGLDGTFFFCVVWLFCTSLSDMKLYSNVLDKDGENSGSQTWGVAVECLKRPVVSM